MRRLRRVIAYIDGFNLYHGLRESKLGRYYWLNLQALAENLLRTGKQLVLTKYFTARISGAWVGDPPDRAKYLNAERKRQSDFLESLEPVFDKEKPIRSTADMHPWYTGNPCEVTRRLHISHCVYDSTWEATEAFELERNKQVAAWVKNDHLGFEVLYIYKGVVQKYHPDLLIRLTNGTMLVLEVKGQDTQQNRTKREFLAEWVKAVNEHGGFGQWAWDVEFDPVDAAGLVAKHIAPGWQ